MASESINDFAIKLGVDATGVATGMAAANAVILQSQREIAKAEAIEREINLQQKMDAEEKFNKWYASELDREFQTWYKMEQQKENILQEEAANRERIARETAVAIQQANINTYNEAISNERRLTTAIEEETQKQLAFSRMLQEAVIARYAAQDAAEQAAIDRADTETQGIMDAAWNRIVAQQRQTLDAFYAEKDRMASESAAHTLRVTEQERKYQEQQEADRIKALREDIQARARAAIEQQRLTEEEAEHYIEQQNRRVAAAFKAQKRIQEDAARFRAGAGAGDMQAATVGGRIPISENTLRMVRAYVNDVEEANRLEREAIGLRRQLMTAEQLHTARLAEYDAMLARNIITQQEHADAVAYSTRIAQASAGGFGGAGAAITQASYAAEDFIQVLSMGGGMNMALMSASNNLSMVARSALGADAAMGALAGFGVPAVLIGLGMLTRYMMDTETATDKATTALEEFRKEQERIGEMTRLRHSAEDETRSIRDMKEREQVEEKIASLKREQARLDETMAQEEMKRAAANAVYFDQLVGGQEAIQEFQDYLTRAIQHGSEEHKKAALEMQQAFNAAREAAIAGNEQAVVDALRRIYKMKGDLLDDQGLEGMLPGIAGIDITMLDRFKAFYNDPALIDAIQEIFDPDIQNLEENREAQRKLAEALISQEEHMTEERKRQLDIVQDILVAQEQLLYLEQQAAGEAQRSRQQRMREELDYMRMSEAEREMKRLRDEQAAFAGIDTAFVGPQLPISEEAFVQDYMDAQLEQIQKEIDQLRKPGYAQGLEQNTYEAQAKAFEQMFKAQFGPRDAQVERLDTLIEIQRQLVEQGAQAPRVNVVPGG